jgi:citrate lyase subunit beta/citryl-CoA lyase
MNAGPLKPIRSFLFVPGNKPGWIEKVVTAKADALILDLEDSVPPNLKVEARGIVQSKLAWLAEQKQRTFVRINKSPHLYDFEDILAVVGPYVEGIVISKPCGPEDVDTVSMMLSEAEYRNQVAIGSTRVIPLLETARALELAYEIAQRERVAALCGATAKNADVARALGYVWSPDGRESLYLKSRAVMAARAAGKLPIGGVWQQVHDLDGLRKSAEKDRALGMTGELLLHPSNVAAVNEIYSPSAEEVAYYEGMIAALEKAKSEGRASTIYDGEHIDIAHAKTAQEIIDLARSFNG